MTGGDGLLCHDPWDWRTDAPEFVPAIFEGFAEGTWDVQPQLPAGAAVDGGKTADGSTHSAASRLAQLRVQYERKLNAKAQAIREMQCRAQQLELETAQMRASRELERRGHLRQLDRCRAILQRYCIPLEEASCTNSAVNHEVLSGVDCATQWEFFARQEAFVTNFRQLQAEPWGVERIETSGSRTAAEQTCGAPETANSGRNSSSSRCRAGNSRSWTLDSDSLQHEGDNGGSCDRRKRSGNSGTGPVGNNNQQQGNSREIPAELSNADRGLGVAWASSNGTKASSSIALTLREMFPHAKIRTEEPTCRQAGDKQQDMQTKEAQAAATASEAAGAACAAGAAELQPEADQLAPEPSDPEAVQTLGSRLGLLERTIGRLTEEPAKLVHEEEVKDAAAEDAFDRFGQLVDVERNLKPIFPRLEWNDSPSSHLLDENGPSPRASSGSADTSRACDGVANSNTLVIPAKLGGSCDIAAGTQLVDECCSPSQPQCLQAADTPASKRSWADISDEDTNVFSELPLSDSLTQHCAKSVDLEDLVREHVMNSLEAKEDDEKATSCSA